MLSRGTWIDERYEILELLGRGGMADVLRAHDAATGDAVAIKVLRDQEVNGFARFRSELAALRVLDHPSIVRLRASGTHNTHPYLGLVLIECLTGTLCYPGSVAEAALARLHRAPVVPAELPTWLHDTLRSMTDREPDRRPPADAVATALQVRSAELLPRHSPHALASVIDRDPTAIRARGRSARRTLRRRSTRIAVAAALLAVTGGAAVLAPLARQEPRVEQPRAEAQNDPSPSQPSTTDPQPSTIATVRTATNPSPAPTVAGTGPVPTEPTTTTPPPETAPAPAAQVPPDDRAGPKDAREPKAPKPPKEPKAPGD